jgi:hypothetical protein
LQSIATYGSNDFLEITSELKLGDEERRCPHCGASIKPTTFACKECGKVVAVQKPTKAADQFFAKVGCAGIVIVALFGVPLTLTTCSRWRAESKTEAAKEAKEKAAKAADDRQQGLHCLLPYLGYSTKFVDAVKQRLRDPDSFEHDKTMIAPAGPDGSHPIIMEYRAKNGFGGMNRSIAVGKLDHGTCEVVSVVVTE